MTEEHKQALIGLCRVEIRRWEAAAEAVPDKKYMVDLMNTALAALTAQPVACKKRLVNHRSGVAHHWTYHGEVDRPSSGDIFRVEVVPLYEHPAPSADLADLVPDELTREAWRQLFINEDYQDTFRCGFSACRAAILRNIEEAK